LSHKQAPCLTKGQERAVLGVCKTTTESLAILIGLYAGLRVAEISGLTLEHIDLDAGQLRIFGKGNRHREIPIHNCLRIAIKEHKAGNKFLFEIKGERLSPDALRVRILRIFKRASLPHSSHSLRRTFATRLAVAPASATLKDIQILLGHSNVSTTARYVDTNPDRLRSIVAMLK